jgi:hypothetical protein
MAIRLPLRTILDYTDTGNVGASSTAGGVAKTFLVPQDTDNIVVKLHPSCVGGTVSATLQTTDDGGTTWYDVVRTPTIETADSDGFGYDQWASAPVMGVGIRSPVLPVSSLTTGVSQVSILQATGSSAASTLGAGQASGLPILGPLNRIFLIYSGDQTVNHTRVKVLVNSQSATA